MSAVYESIMRGLNKVELDVIYMIKAIRHEE